MANSTDVPNTGSFSTQDVRPWDKPQLVNSKPVAFAAPYSGPPGLALGLNVLDISAAANVRLAASASSVTAQGFTANLNSWADTVLYTAACSWLEVAPENQAIQIGQFNTTEDHSWQKPQPHTERKVTFARPFSAPPQVVVWLTTLDMAAGRNRRVAVYATHVTAAGFTINVDAWGDTVLYAGAAAWIAYPAGAANLRSGSFNTQDLRPWNQPRSTNSGAVQFSGGALASVPRVIVGLNSMDVGGAQNLRLNARADGVTAKGFTWHLDSWADTVLYSAGASYLAIG